MTEIKKNKSTNKINITNLQIVRELSMLGCSHRE